MYHSKGVFFLSHLVLFLVWFWVLDMDGLESGAVFGLCLTYSFAAGHSFSGAVVCHSLLIFFVFLLSVESSVVSLPILSYPTRVFFFFSCFCFCDHRTCF